jgi:hypothetical protein
MNFNEKTKQAFIGDPAILKKPNAQSRPTESEYELEF